MAIHNFSTENFLIVVNGRSLADWGTTDPSVTHEPIDQVSDMVRGMGGDALRLDRVAPGRRYTINLQPGSQDSAFMQQLMNSKANITISTTQIGTLDKTIASEGVIVNDGSTGRAGQSPTDDQYIIEFNKFSQTKGS